MASKPQTPLLLLAPLPFLLLLFVAPTPAAAHNVTHILEQFPEFGNFNALLTQSGVAAEINRRQTITVLVVDNAAASALSGLDPETVRQVLAVHVILDYYDDDKIQGLLRRSTIFTTLFQTTGVAAKRMGFLNATRLSDGRFALGSAEPGAPLLATFVKNVATRPYNISVLQVSSVIVPPGINGSPMAPFGAPIVAPPEFLVPAPAPVVDDEDDSVADGPADGPEASATSPAAEGPAGDGPGPASAAEADAPEAEDQTSSAGRVAGEVSAGLVVMASAVFLAI